MNYHSHQNQDEIWNAINSVEKEVKIEKELFTNGTGIGCAEMV